MLCSSHSRIDATLESQAEVSWRGDERTVDIRYSTSQLREDTAVDGIVDTAGIRKQSEVA